MFCNVLWRVFLFNADLCWDIHRQYDMFLREGFQEYTNGRRVVHTITSHPKSAKIIFAVQKFWIETRKDKSFLNPSNNTCLRIWNTWQTSTNHSNSIYAKLIFDKLITKAKTSSPKPSSTKSRQIWQTCIAEVKHHTERSTCELQADKLSLLTLSSRTNHIVLIWYEKIKEFQKNKSRKVATNNANLFFKSRDHKLRSTPTTSNIRRKNFLSCSCDCDRNYVVQWRRILVSRCWADPSTAHHPNK